MAQPRAFPSDPYWVHDLILRRCDLAESFWRRRLSASVSESTHDLPIAPQTVTPAFHMWAESPPSNAMRSCINRIPQDVTSKQRCQRISPILGGIIISSSWASGYYTNGSPSPAKSSTMAAVDEREREVLQIGKSPGGVLGLPSWMGVPYWQVAVLSTWFLEACALSARKN